MSKTFCVNKRDKSFIEIRKKYGITSGYLENLAHQYYNETGSDDYSTDDFIDYIETAMNIDTEIEMPKKYYDAALEAYNEGGKEKGFKQTIKNLEKIAEQLKSLFGEDGISIIELAEEGDEKVGLLRMAKPILKKAKSSKPKTEDESSDDNEGTDTSVNPFNITKIEESKRAKYAKDTGIIIDHIEAPTNKDIKDSTFSVITIVTTKGNRIQIDPKAGFSDRSNEVKTTDIKAMIGLNYLLEQYLINNPSEVSKFKDSTLSKNTKELYGNKYNSSKDSFKNDYALYISTHSNNNVDTTKLNQNELRESTFYKRMNVALQSLINRIDSSGIKEAKAARNLYSWTIQANEAVLKAISKGERKDEVLSLSRAQKTIDNLISKTPEQLGKDAIQALKYMSRDFGKSYLDNEVNTTKLNQAVNTVKSIINDAKRRIQFNKEDHSYTVDGKKADISVTQYLNKEEYGAWGIPSSAIGNTFDSVTRDFFQKNLKESYPNLTKSQLNSLIEDLVYLKKHFDSLYGEGKYEVFTDENLRIATNYTEIGKNGKPVTKTMAGTMDMIIATDKGEFHIWDMKTSRSGFDEGRLNKYTRQISAYKAILESQYPQMKGKIKSIGVIPADVYYPNPTNVDYDTTEEGELIVDGNNIEKDKRYQAPTINRIVLKSTNLKPVKSINAELSQLSEEDRAAIEEEFGSKPIIKSTKKVEQSRKDANTSGLYNNPKINASERRFLGDYVMRMASLMITKLVNGENTYGFDKDFPGIDFTRMDRKEIINKIGIGRILDYIRQNIINPTVRMNDDMDLDVYDKLKIAYDNFGALTRSAYFKLITLEGVTVVEANDEDIIEDGIDEETLLNNDTGTIEEKEQEYWQIGVRNLSVRSRLSSEIKRVFEGLMVTDSNGNIVTDKFGFGLQTFVDSNVAVNSILEWVHNCTTMEEMEEELNKYKELNPWLNTVLEKIKEEPFRSQFFQKFREDFTNYSIVTVERDEKGKAHYVTTIINTRGAASTILNSVKNQYNTGSLKTMIIPIKGDIEGRGSVNVKEVTKNNNRLNEIVKTLYGKRSRKQQLDYMNSIVPEISIMLNEAGVVVNSQVLKSLIASDSNRTNLVNTKFSKVLEELGYIYETLLENKDNKTYNPLIKGEEGNIYGNYRNIVNTMSSFIQDAIEASTYENGKMYYSFNLPSYLGKTIKNLSNAADNKDKFNKYIEDEYKSYKFFYDKETGEWNNVWLKLLQQEKYRNALSHKVQLSFNKTPYTDLSELGYTLSLMSEYFYDDKGQWAWYRVPILANKPSSEFVRFKRYSGRNYKRDIKEGFRTVMDQEIMRMKTVLERAVNKNVEKIGTKGKTVTFDIKDGIIDSKLAKKIKNGTLTFNDIIKNGKYIFANSGAEFKFLPLFNDHLVNKTDLGKFILAKLNGQKVDEAKLNTSFEEAVDNAMGLIVANEKKQWRKLGLYDTEKKTKYVREGKKKKEIEVEAYKYIGQLGEDIDEIEAKLEEYVWNDMFATINIIQLTGTDLAYYKNVEDFQKRWSQIHAPSMKFNTTATFKDANGNKILYSKDGKARTMYLKDEILKQPEIIKNVRGIFNRKIAKLQGKEKEDLSIMRDLVLSALEGVNVTDAQGFSSPTSYRKKMGMSGRWDETMEKAYQQIKSGNLNVHDLGVLWQPLKPFVYSQVRKSSGAKTMKELKVPIQNKNSEYLLILADAIMRGGNQVNRLSAIYDFMEESAYDNGVYNGIGIDTIQFASAVNVGSMGVIDINEAKSPEEVKDILRNNAYINDDMRESSDNDMDRYNEQYVHTFSFDDYGIQQEVPNHLQDHEQLMGSQVRILSISDITPGTIFDVYGKGKVKSEDLINEYNELIAKNIKESFNQLSRDLKLKGTRKERNEALSALLKDSILKDQRYGDDLLRACSLDENGEFVIPLNDPIQSIRIQQLLNSVIKSRINKQKVKGGPVVQATSFGLSEDLHIRFKDNGELDYFEAYMPIPSTEMEEALTKEDGSLMTIDEALKAGVINEEMFKAIAYRIPTEDKYSMMPIKIVGFVPKSAGEVIILPKEITQLTGSDKVNV